MEPAVGRLTGADSGPGRLPDAEHIEALADLLLRRSGGAARATWRACGVVVSAGGTREPLDPVRFLGNRSSGRQGYALALVAAARGAQVTLVVGERRAAPTRRPSRWFRSATPASWSAAMTAGLPTAPTPW